MTGAAPTNDLTPDPTFSPEAYERVAWLLRSGVLAFLILAGVGMVAYLILNPSETLASLLSSNPTNEFTSVGVSVGYLEAGRPEALILLGILVMVAATIGRVLLVTVDFFRGGERALGAISAAVIVLLIVGLFVVGPFVH
ncbi:MAG: DUF1634 domain-containing protein [Thermoplasmata archaeon]